MQEAVKYIENNLPDGANGLWALLHCDQWNAIGELGKLKLKKTFKKRTF